MTREPNAMPSSQLGRWSAVGLLILAAVVLYFRTGRRVPPLTQEAVADTAARPVPAAAEPR